MQWRIKNLIFERGFMMTTRWILLGISLSFLIIFFEWSDKSMFLFQVEAELLFTAKRNLHNFSHPLILLPFLGQIVLLVPVFKQGIPVRYSLMATILPGLLVFMVLLTGVLSGNVKMVVSTLPFIFFAVLLIRVYRREKTSSRSQRLNA